ncbi:helix-turn-helix transcriptional regulator [Cellulophaga sp. 20_2_10]|uniref:AraC family transcriptional regulator n=1 Tax=Cellulophaga sp. 20_2_10 TaxID=2942476 RepID=UPI00201A5EC7|nr:helix-turn-helix domain-containing protein [Cellulophaga sp. 20_2_10]MCL5246222.1 helix-turn-helix transcriptional regulator [Cellulophaga sp. 20_2_10]
MKVSNVQQVKFENERVESQFDIIMLDDLLSRDIKDHTLYDFQQINFYMMLFYTSGTGVHTIDFTDYEINKGTILSIRKDQIHKFGQTDAQGYLLLFTDEFLMQFFEESEVLKTLQLFNELLNSPKVQLNSKQFTEIDVLATEIYNEYFQVNDQHSLGIVRSLLHILFRKILRLKSGSDAITMTKKYLPEFVNFQSLVENQCFTTKKVLDYAGQMMISTKTLNNITNTIVHKSAKQFIDEILVKQIKRLLINTDVTIKEIAYTTGFEEPTNLYKFFKKNTGLTPEQFRISKI